MNLLQTNENFSSLSRKEKINMLKGMSAGTIPTAEPKQLEFTVIALSKQRYSIMPGGEIINVPEGETIERYLERKFPLNRIGLQKIDEDSFLQNGQGNFMAA